MGFLGERVEAMDETFGAVCRDELADGGGTAGDVASSTSSNAKAALQ